MLVKSFKGIDLTQQIALEDPMKSCNLEIFFLLYFYV
jgi:hypothetical protein